MRDATLAEGSGGRTGDHRYNRRAAARAEVGTTDCIIYLLEGDGDLLNANIEALCPQGQRSIVGVVGGRAQLADAVLKLQERRVVALECQAAALEALVARVHKHGRGWAMSFLQPRRLKQRRRSR